MSDQNTKTHTNEEAEPEHTGDKPDAQWKKIIVGAWHHFSPKYLSNLLFLIVGFLIAPSVGIVMNNQKAVIYGAAGGLTLLLWLFAFHMAHQVQPRPKN